MRTAMQAYLLILIEDQAFDIRAQDESSGVKGCGGPDLVGSTHTSLWSPQAFILKFIALA